MFKTTILVEPVAKGRPKVAMNRYSGRPVVYTPTKTRQAEAEIRTLIYNQLPEDLKGELFDPETAIRLEATFYLPRPKSKPKRITMPTTKPDLDNLVKTLTDALQGFVFKSDSQITTATIKKRYGEPTRIELQLGGDDD
jgi:Holliday junction resolvase RusA-like endonuclease